MAEVFTLLLMAGMLMCGLLLHTVSQHGASVDELSKKPNFIIILADDIGWGDLDANQPEQKVNNTPYLNLMAEQGLRLTDFHSPASTCSPSRAAILTGRYGLRNGVTHNFAVGSVAGLPLSEVTLPQLLQKAGYYTAMIGKWHLGHNGPYNPTYRVTSKHYKVYIPARKNEMATWTLKQRGQPYLLYIALAHMHVPLAPPLPPDASATARRPGDCQVYAASLREMDGLVGAVKRASDDADKGNTLIWFTGDNGPWEQKCQYAGSVGPFMGKWQTSRGGGSAKQTTWEGGHRVPTVAYWPGRIPANTTSSALLSGMDIFPTLLSLAGVTPPSERRYDGIDATDILLRGEHVGHEFLFHPNSGAAGKFGDLQTIRTGTHKAFYITGKLGAAEACGGATGRQQLHDPPLIFNLDRDRAEETPLEVGTPEYQVVAERIARRREELLWDIATDKSVSTADYSTEQSAVPCCDPTQPVCRCYTLG
ncbi:hypothetical protein L3Q82_001137 [Scortum barcoo]|uniref:Uncharacterized protein n=1 Tax=Scortum barcoo TaxID=214431 RepID=A0ACB8WBJ9_9TELE|nr:hypothetical protein L3Q82_001137 [Scortum barcoo]